MTATTWTGSVSTDWLTAGNWDTSGVPGSGDDVMIGSTGNSPSLNASISVNSITINGTDTLTLTNASLVATNGITLSSTGGISGTGTLGPVTVSGAATIAAGSGGTLEMTGAITDSGHALVLSVTDGSELLLDAASQANTVHFGTSATLEVGSTLTVVTAMTISLATLHLDAGSVVTDAGGVTIGGFGRIVGQGALAAAVTVSGAATIQAGAGGTLEVTGTITDSGHALLLVIDDSAVLQLDAASAANQMRFSGLGGTLELRSALTVGTATQIFGNTLQLDGPGSAFTDGSGVTLNNSGEIIGQGKITGVITGPGAVIASGGTLELASTIGASDNTAFEIANSAASVLLLDAAPGAGNTFSFLGASGGLALASDAGFADTISGLDVGSSGVKTNFVDIVGHTVTINSITGRGTTSGTIFLSDGPILYLTNLSSEMWTANAVADGAGGIDIFVSAPPPDPFANPAWNIALTADFNNDGMSDLVWRRASDGLVEIQFFNGNSAIGGGSIANSPFDSTWNITGKGDFNGDGHIDLIWQRISDGLPEIQLLNGTTGIGGGTIVNNAFDSSWIIFGSGDFNGDHKTDLVWKRKSDGLLEIQLLNGNVNAGGGIISNNPFDSTWHIFGSGDFNGDGKSDLIWQRSSDGLLEIQFLNGNINAGGGVITNNPFDASWSLFGTGDFNGDGKADLVWRRNSDGLVEIQFLDGNTAIGGGTIANNPFDSSWAVAGVGDFNGDGKSDLIWRRISDGLTEIQFLDGNNAIGGGAATAMRDSPFFPVSPGNGATGGVATMASAATASLSDGSPQLSQIAQAIAAFAAAGAIPDAGSLDRSPNDPTATPPLLTGSQGLAHFG